MMTSLMTYTVTDCLLRINFDHQVVANHDFDPPGRSLSGHVTCVHQSHTSAKGMTDLLMRLTAAALPIRRLGPK